MTKAFLLLMFLLTAACSGPTPDAGDAPSCPSEAHPGGSPSAEDPALGGEGGAGGDAPVAPPVTEWQAQRLTATWTMSDEFSPEEVESIVAAADAWETVTEGRVSLTMVVGPVPDATALWTISRGPVGGKENLALGQSHLESAGARIRLDAEVFEGAACVGQLWAVAAHEIGHALGIVSHGANGVMASGSWPSCDATFTRSDVLMFDVANPI